MGLYRETKTIFIHFYGMYFAPGIGNCAEYLGINLDVGI